MVQCNFISNQNKGKVLNIAALNIVCIPSCSVHVVELVEGLIETVVTNQKIPDISNLAC